jgi:YfiH family protein
MTDALLADGLALPHGFFTRAGGVSGGDYASLNCSLSGRDDPDAVRENRGRAARAVGVASELLLGLTQVHGIDVVTVAQPWGYGAGPRADAAVSDRAGVALGIVTADCAPILFADPAAGVIGAAHAGWRGALGGVIEATVAAMVGLGASAAGIAAAVGPCIGQQSYEVGEDLLAAVLARDAADRRFFGVGRRAGHWQFDLAGYCAARLLAAGVERVATVAADTMADERRFFSHRRRTLAGGGAIGHQISIIALPG